MDFSKLEQVSDGQIFNKYAAKLKGEWVEGTVSTDFLNANFGSYENATEMKNATTSEGLQLFFDDLVEQGKIQP